jgi:hypothetical protein
MRVGRTPTGGIMKLGRGLFVDPPEVMNHANFHLHMMNILRDSGGQKRGFAFEIHLALSKMPCATVLASDIRKSLTFDVVFDIISSNCTTRS